MTARYEGLGIQPAGLVYFCRMHEKAARAGLEKEYPDASCSIYSVIVGVPSCVRCTDAADYAMLYRREGEAWLGPRVAREHLCGSHMEATRSVLDQFGVPPGFTGYRVLSLPALADVRPSG
jgi:hypothetical protein